MAELNRKLARMVDRLVDKKFALGKQGLESVEPDKGLDCLNSLYHIYKHLGFDFPTEWKGYNVENYADRWNKSNCREDFAEFLQTLGREINPNYRLAGDLMLFEGKEIPMFPAIYLGNGKMLMIFKQGVRVVPYKFFNNCLKSCRRLV